MSHPLSFHPLSGFHRSGARETGRVAHPMLSASFALEVEALARALSNPPNHPFADLLCLRSVLLHNYVARVLTRETYTTATLRPGCSPPQPHRPPGSATPCTILARLSFRPVPFSFAPKCHRESSTFAVLYFPCLAPGQSGACSFLFPPRPHSSPVRTLRFVPDAAQPD